MANLHCYKRDDARWAWRLTADNGAVIATDGGQGYENYTDCQRMADAIVINGSFKDARRTKDPD